MNISPDKKIMYLVIGLRICTPLLIFIQPLLALGTSLVLDAIDGQLFFNAGYRWEQYNRVDKILDYWWYICIIIFFWSSALFIPALLFFIFRSIGQALGIILKKEKIYVLFPNILEWFFLLSILFPSVTLGIQIGISIIMAICVEFFIHVKNPHLLSKYYFHHEIQWELNEKNV